MAGAEERLSKSQVNKAGRAIRKTLSGEDIPREAFLDAVMVLRAYRASHSQPLAKATMGLRSVVKTEGCAVEVSQRLKRAPTILDKIVRQPTMALSKMQDIAGCRAVLADMDELRRVEKRLRKNRPPLASTTTWRIRESPGTGASTSSWNMGKR